MTMPTELDIWNKLHLYYEETGKQLDLRELFKNDSNRFKSFSISLKDPSILFDYSKNLVTSETMSLLINLAQQSGVEEYRKKMFSGEPINITEGRAVFHVALRNTSGKAMRLANGEDVMTQVMEELETMHRISDQIRDGSWKGFTGKRITDVVNIGIGGSDLGPVMVCEALKHFCHPEINVHFVSNIDGTHLAETLLKLNPETTVFIIVSKTFTTAETITNAISAKDWFLKSTNGERSNIRKHFVAVSTNTSAVTNFGIDENNMVKFWDWVGGRYSLWSGVGLIIMISIGYERFWQLLEGAHLIDEHFKSAPLNENIPVIMALLGVWYNNFFGAQSHAILPYEQYLNRFPAYLQQADMESNGKSSTIDGNNIRGIYQTGPIIWGEPGTNGQHAFYQLIHQGTKLIPADFLLGKRSLLPIKDERHHRMLIANCLAQTEALMVGKSESTIKEELSKETPERRNLLLQHKSFPGNKPTNTILYDCMSPRTLGALVALYEHKIFVQGVIWRINSFDQWGVELGKQLANIILDELEVAKVTKSHDGSTMNLLNEIIQSQGELVGHQ